MGQLSTPGNRDIILTDVDRLVARNADGGLSPASAHVILLGQDAGRNLAASNIIALGFDALDAGLLAGGDGNIAIGHNASGSLTTSGGFGTLGSNVVIGENAMAAADPAGFNVVIGGSALGAYVAGSGGAEASRNVIIGHNAFGISTDPNSFVDNIIIGTNAGGGSASNRAVQAIVIGSGAVSGAGTGAGISMTGVVIGALAATNYRPSADVIIGRQCVTGKPTGSNGSSVFIGDQITCTGGGQSVVIGANCDIGGGDSMTILGQGIVFRNDRSIVIGHSAGNGAAANSDTFIVETQFAGTNRAMFYGDMNAGSVVIGRSTNGVDRDLGGVGASNIVKLINGAKGATNPAGGGYFYATAGQVHWVDGAGTDTALTTAAAGGFTVATLPAGFRGQRTYVTDAAAPAFGAVLVGGGAVVIPAFFDGVNWIAA